jgi:phage terminase small subunit
MKHLNKRAREIYKNIVEDFTANKNCVDLDLIAAYAVEMETFERACHKINESEEITPAPSGYPMINPWYTIRKQSLKATQDIAKILAMTQLQDKQKTKITKLELLTHGKKIQNSKIG